MGVCRPGHSALVAGCRVPPPDPDEHDLDPRTVLRRATSAYKMATVELRTLVEKKGKLQAKAHRAKAEFEKAVQELAAVSQAIEQQTESVAQAQEEVRRKVADQEQPRIQDFTGILRAVGVELTEAQQSAVFAKMAAANAATTAAPVPELPAFDVWMSKKPAPKSTHPGFLARKRSQPPGRPDQALQRGPGPRSLRTTMRVSRVLGGGDH